MILGVDGGTLDLIQPWVRAGLLPTFARLMAEGSWGRLRTMIPPVTPTAWSSFLTGMNPGRHGLYDFVGRRRGTYDTWLANASYRTGDPVWRILSRAGRKVTVFNVPLTYPIEPVNGAFVSGFLTPADATDTTWPPELLDEIKRQVPEFNFSPPGAFSHGEELDFLNAIAELNCTTLRTARFLMEREPWDFFTAVFMGADIVSHFMWRAMIDGRRVDSAAAAPAQARMAGAIQECYRQIDAALGELIAAAGPDVHLIVMSDHGFGSLERYIHINAWLRQRGYLRLKRAPFTLLKRAMYRLGINPMSVYETLRRLGFGERMRSNFRRRSTRVQKLIDLGFLSFADVDWARTRLFSMGFAGPIYVNLRGRDPQGCVAPGAEYEAVLEQVTADLRNLRDPETGDALIGEIYRREQLYWGPRVDEAPDLVFMPRDMKDGTFGLMAFGSNRWLTRVADRTGTHRMDGIVFVHGPGVRPGVQLAEASILDIAPTVLALMGEPIPAAMDGHVLERALQPELYAALQVRVADSQAGTPQDAPPSDLTADEEEILRKRLRDLGYVA